jgi:hypothetical protein
MLDFRKLLRRFSDLESSWSEVAFHNSSNLDQRTVLCFVNHMFRPSKWLGSVVNATLSILR